MNYAIGNVTFNNVSFGHYGTVYWLYGLSGVIVVALLLGLLFGLGVRLFGHVWGAAILGAVVPPADSPETTFPNYLVGLAVLANLRRLGSPFVSSRQSNDPYPRE